MSFEGQLDTHLGDLPVAVTYEGVYEPAYLGGAPEDCWPDSSELDITAVIVNGCDLIDFLSEKTMESLREQCWEDFHAGRDE